jgi:hypothetical protein
MAVHLEIAQEDRALGKALAENPFPFIIPSHRAVRSEGSNTIFYSRERAGSPREVNRFRYLRIRRTRRVDKPKEAEKAIQIKR